MDIRWKDGEENILNANKDRIIYLEASTNIKTVIRNKEVKKITIDDGLMNIFRDFKNGLILTIVIPKRNKRNAVKIFNEYDKTGDMFKKGTGNALTEVFLNVFLDLSLVLINPLAVFLTVPLVLLLIFGIVKVIFESLFGDVGTYIAYAALFAYPVYAVIRYTLLRFKRRRLKEMGQKEEYQ